MRRVLINGLAILSVLAVATETALAGTTVQCRDQSLGPGLPPC